MSKISQEQINLNIATSKARRDVQRAAPKAPAKPQSAFKDAASYVGYRRHLAESYHGLSQSIRQVKAALRNDYRPDGMTYREAQAWLASLREEARMHMITLEAIKASRPQNQKAPTAYN